MNSLAAGSLARESNSDGRCELEKKIEESERVREGESESERENCTKYPRILSFC